MRKPTRSMHTRGERRAEVFRGNSVAAGRDNGEDLTYLQHCPSLSEFALELLSGPMPPAAQAYVSAELAEACLAIRLAKGYTDREDW